MRQCPLGLLEQLAPFFLANFDMSPPSCYLSNTITVLLMCWSEACPLLIQSFDKLYDDPGEGASAEIANRICMARRLFRKAVLVVRRS